MRRFAAPALAAGLLLGACAGGPPGPAPLDRRNDACSYCRMSVSDPRFAAQLVAPAEEPKFFDDIGCLAAHLKERRPAPRAVGYVADHFTGSWVVASRALYTRVPGLATPMGSHLVAHADAASRDADPDARDGVSVSLADVFGPGGPPGGDAPAAGGRP